MPTEMISPSAEMRKGVGNVKATERVGGTASVSPLVLRQLGQQFSEQAVFNSRSYMHRAAQFENRKQSISHGVGTLRAANEAMTGIQLLLEEGDELLTQSRKAKTREEIDEFASKYNDLLDRINQQVKNSSRDGINLLEDGNQHLDIELGKGAVPVQRINGTNLTSEGLELKRVEADGWFFANTKSVNRKDIEAERKQLGAAALEVIKEQARISDALETVITYQDFTGGQVNIAKDVGKERALLKMESRDIEKLMAETQALLQETDGGLLSRTASAVFRRM